jgi:hypothetical protein
MLYEDFMSNVEGSSNKGNTSKEDLIMSNEDDDQHDPSNSQMITHQKTFYFQNCCRMLAFGNDCNLTIEY